MNQNSRRVTIQHIAEQLGISKHSVSKALRGQTGVSQATRDQVLTTARQLGYALAPSPGESPDQPVVMLLLPRPTAVDTAVWPRILLGVQEALQVRGATLTMATVSEEEQATNTVPTALEHMPVAGVLCVGQLDPSYVACLRALGHALVLADNHLPELEVDSVMSDDYSGSRSAVQHLVMMGHRRIGFIGNNYLAPGFHRRWMGYRDAMEEHGLRSSPEWSILLSDPDEAPWGLGFPADRLRLCQDLPDAWVCVNDRTAHSLVRALNDMGLRVPDDASVIGFDDIDESVHFTPPLTTVRVYREALGARSVERLYNRIAAPDAPPDLTLISTRLTVRDSVGPL